MQTNGLALLRGTDRVAREQMAENLTRKRDGFFEALAACARDDGLPRDWLKQFFRAEQRKSVSTSSGDETASDGIA